MGKLVTLQCPRCGNEQHDAWFSRRVCCSCRFLEDKYRTRTPVGRAWTTVTRAIKSGQLTRQPCEVCGNPKSDAHHDDYAKQLEVRWLCRLHHKQHHAKFGPGLNSHKEA